MIRHYELPRDNRCSIQRGRFSSFDDGIQDFERNEAALYFVFSVQDLIDSLSPVRVYRMGRCLRLVFAMLFCMGKWCTVTVTDGEGKRYSLDVNADSSYDAAHLYLTHVRGHPGCGLPIPTTSMQFEVVTDGRIQRSRRPA